MKKGHQRFEHAKQQLVLLRKLVDGSAAFAPVRPDAKVSDGLDEQAKTLDQVVQRLTGMVV